MLVLAAYWATRTRNILIFLTAVLPRAIDVDSDAILFALSDEGRGLRPFISIRERELRTLMTIWYRSFFPLLFLTLKLFGD